MVETMPWDSKIDHTYTTTYVYNGDKLVKSEKDCVFPNEEELSPTAPVKEVTSYVWQGDNVVAARVDKELLNGGHDTEEYSLEYTTLLNPFCQDMFIQTKILSMAGLENGSAARSKYLPKTMATVGQTVYYYEYTTVGDRVVSIVRDNTAEVKEMRITTHAVYDLEYAE